MDLLRRVLPVVLSLIVISGAGRGLADNAESTASLVIVGSPEDDLPRVLRDNGKETPTVANVQEALIQVADRGAVMVLASHYPEQPTVVPEEFFQEAARRGLKVYLEFPAQVPGVVLSKPRQTQWERIVVQGDPFGEQLASQRIMSMNRSWFIPMRVADSSLVLARVAGFDRAVYGIPEDAWTLLGHLPATDDRPELWIGAGKLSDFVTGRYAPAQAWQAVWQKLLGQLDPSLVELDLKWEPMVRPSYSVDATLPEDVERVALKRGAQWYIKSGLLLTEETARIARAASQVSELGDHAPYRETQGDGRFGMLEGFDAGILPDGSQKVRVIQRSDCISETAMGLAVAGKTLGDPRMTKIAANLQEYLYERSGAVHGERGDPEHPSFGMISWGVTNDAWMRANYGDDIARVILATMATQTSTGDTRWDPYLARAVLAGLRITGRRGFQPDRVDQPDLTQHGWETYLRQPTFQPSPHFQAYMWACYLWAHQQSGDEYPLKQAKAGIAQMMAAYPDNWIWTNGIQQERARMLLPLDWLVRVDDTPRHRQWLRQIAMDIIACQDESGAIREELGRLDRGRFPPHHDNASFGAHEAPLIHENGEPLSDLLYTSNFAFLGLHEAAAATGDPLYQEAEDKLTQFLCRIQTRSEVRPELDGAWMRAFDFKRWDYWGSNGDAGWGAWSIESGWTQGWIVAVLGMRQQKTSLWEMATDLKTGETYRDHRSWMLPQKILDSVTVPSVRHAAVECPVELLCTPAPQYNALGSVALSNGILGTQLHTDPEWIGIEGESMTAILDLQDARPLHKVEIYALQAVSSGIYYPPGVRISISEEGKNFTPWAEVKFESTDDTPVTAAWFAAEGPPKSGRFVRVEVESRKTIPAGHHSAGRPAWLFVSEIAVDREMIDSKEVK